MNKSQQWSSSGCECTSGFEDIHLSLLQIDAHQSKTASMFLHFVSFFSFLPPSGRCTEPAHMSLWCLLLKSLPPHPSLPESMVDCEHLAMILKQTAAKAGPQLGYRARAEARMPSLSLSPFSFSLCASFFVECGMYVLSGDVPVDLLSVKGGWGWQLSQTSSRISVSRCWNILLLSGRQVTVSDHQSVVTPRTVAVINSCFY